MMRPWSRAEDKIFEKALVDIPEGTNDRWWKIVEFLPKRSPNEVQQHYEDLLHDIQDIESGLIEPPVYPDDDIDSPNMISMGSPRKRSRRSRQSSAQRKKGVPWTEEEHRLFLYGLEKYGKGDWRGISREVVKTKTPQQVASHAQKYYQRLESKGGKRASIHDITSPVASAPSPAVVPPPPPPRYLPDQDGFADSIFGEWYLQN